MYVVAIFALALLSPLPFVSPFVYDVQNVEAQIPFDTSDRDISSPIETAPQKFDSYDLTSSTDNTNNQSYAEFTLSHNLLLPQKSSQQVQSKKQGADLSNSNQIVSVST